MPELADRAAAVRAQFNECFGCGLDNPIGLQLDDFQAANGELSVRFTPRRDFRGFADILHGGIVATMLDETLAWTAMMFEGTYVVTARLELKYRKPAPADAIYELRGRVVERRGRRLRLAGDATAGDTLVAEATGLFLATEAIGG